MVLSWGYTCHWISGAQPSSNASGRRYVRSLQVQPSATQRLPNALARPKRRGLLRRLVTQTGLLSPSSVIVWSKTMAHYPVIAGASSANGRSCRKRKGTYEDTNNDHYRSGACASPRLGADRTFPQQCRQCRSQPVTFGRGMSTTRRTVSAERAVP